jgi:hypothetical protein
VPLIESRYDPKLCQAGGRVVSKIKDFKRVLQDPNAGKAEKQKSRKAASPHVLMRGVSLIDMIRVRDLFFAEAQEIWGRSGLDPGTDRS